MLSKKIRSLRKGHGYSQQQLAMKLHVTQGAVSQWESGDTVPATEQLTALADLFGTTVDALLSREEAEPDEAMELRERLRRDPSMRLLFDTAKKATPDQIRAAAAMLKALRNDDEIQAD